MTSTPSLLFLHGIGDAGPDGPWRRQLAETLTRLGYPGLDDIHVIAPRYAHALRGDDDRLTLPPLNKSLRGDAARQNRRNFERRMAAMEERLGRHEQGNGFGIVDGVASAAVAAVLDLPHKNLLQARSYLTDDGVRAGVLHRILAALPASGRLVIVAHSLGSVIAADLLRRLPMGIEVTGMVTIGSPLASGEFDVDKLRDALREPPPNLGWWVNYWNVSDPVVGRRGLSSVFPWMVDFRVRRDGLLGAHAARMYLELGSVVEAIGYGLFGSRSQELSFVERGVDLVPDEVETMALLALRYAHLLSAQLSGDVGDRFAGALRQVQAMTVAGIRSRNTEQRRSLPSAIAQLSFDPADLDASVPTPTPVRHLSKEDAVVPLTVLAAENVVKPFEISVPRDRRHEAMAALTVEMGLGRQLGLDVFRAAKEAQDQLSGGVNWFKLGAIGAGAALLAVATGGLALAVGPGLAGGAAIVSALAAFGPGGMMGGLLTAGTLVTAGGGSIAFGLASPGTAAETVEAVVARQLAAEILRQSQGLDPDPAVWENLAGTEVAIRRQYERLDEFSDERSSALAELKRKLVAIQRAIDYLVKHDLVPSSTRSTSEPSWSSAG